MMQIFKKVTSTLIAGAVIATSLYPTIVSAKYEQTGNDGIRLYGSTACKEEGHTVCVDVYTENMNADDLRSAISRDLYPNIIAYRNETETGKDGAYDITFSMGPRKSGTYDAYIYCDCGEEIITEKVVYSNPEENKAAIALINACAAESPAAEVKKVLTDYAAALGLSSETEINEALAKLTSDGESGEKLMKRICSEYSFVLGFISDYETDSFAVSLMLKEVKASALDVSDKTAAIALYKKAVAMAAVKSGKLSNLFNEAEMLNLDDSDIADYYKNDYVTADFGADVTQGVKTAGFDTAEDFYDVLSDQLVLTVVKKSGGYEDIQKAVKGILGVSITKNQALKVMNNTYESVEKLKDAFGTGTGGGGGTGTGTGGNKGGVTSSGGSVGGGTYSGDFTKGDAPEKLNKNIFTDIDDVTWATEPIVELAQLGIISGRGDGLFCPNDYITREEFVKIIVGAFFANAEEADAAFDDVESGAWYEKYVKQGVGSGVINGIGENLFGTGANITREDTAVIAYRAALAAKKLEEAASAETFAFDDDGDIADYAKDAVYALYSAGVINGTTAETFEPKAQLTRAQAAKIVYFIYNLN